MKILNLGAGNRIISGADNHDINDVGREGKIQLIFDLDDISQPSIDFLPVDWLDKIVRAKCQYYPDCEASDVYLYDKIEFISVIEHLKITPIEALNQCWHLLKPGGILVVKYPHYTSKTAYDDPTHKHWLTENSLDYVDPSTQHGKDYSYYTPYKWKIETAENERIIKNRNVKMILRKI